MSDADDYLHAYAVKALQGVPDAIWQVETPAGAVGRIYLLLTKEAAVAPSVDHLDDFRAAREVEKSIISAPKSVLAGTGESTREAPVT